MSGKGRKREAQWIALAKRAGRDLDRAIDDYQLHENDAAFIDAVDRVETVIRVARNLCARKAGQTVKLKNCDSKQ